MKGQQKTLEYIKFDKKTFCKQLNFLYFIKSNNHKNYESCEFLHKREDTENMKILLQENKELKEQIESTNKIIEQLTGKMEAMVQRVERLERDKTQDNHIVFKHPETEKNNFPPAFVFSENADNPLKSILQMLQLILKGLSAFSKNAKAGGK